MRSCPFFVCFLADRPNQGDASSGMERTHEVPFIMAACYKRTMGLTTKPCYTSYKQQPDTNCFCRPVMEERISFSQEKTRALVCVCFPCLRHGKVILRTDARMGTILRVLIMLFSQTFHFLLSHHELPKIPHARLQLGPS